MSKDKKIKIIVILFFNQPQSYETRNEITSRKLKNSQICRDYTTCYWPPMGKRRNQMRNLKNSLRKLKYKQTYQCI